MVERLAGTPARAAALVEGVQRVREFLAGAAVLSAADPSNRQTEAASHQTMPIPGLLRQLQQNRRELVQVLEILAESEIARTARHPRLRVPMRVIDWAQFVADHDDHHLAAARLVLHSLAEARP